MSPQSRNPLVNSGAKGANNGGIKAESLPFCHRDALIQNQSCKVSQLALVFEGCLSTFVANLGRGSFK